MDIGSIHVERKVIEWVIEEIQTARKNFSTVKCAKRVNSKLFFETVCGGKKSEKVDNFLFQKYTTA